VSSQPEATEKSMIIIADQHAVDERILLEKLLKSILDPMKQVDQERRLASNGCILLSPPRKLQVSSSEVEKALQYRSIFNRWGIDFFASPDSHLSMDPQENTATSDSRHFRQLRSASKYFGQKMSSRTDDTHYIQVTKIPRVISDRCTTNPMLLKEIICDHIAWMESQSQSQQIDDNQPDDGFGAWSRYLRYCPRGMVDILKSKACRNAIMFNDSLTGQQCQKLIDLVSDCVFPFQCAHGRYEAQGMQLYSLKHLLSIKFLFY
jgi:DNA mismatch repair protein MLH3